MLFASAHDYKDSPRKAVTAFGMSGVGKTMVATHLRRSGWFHYSVDYRIGTRYMASTLWTISNAVPCAIRFWRVC